jgi:hypothetical protein
VQLVEWGSVVVTDLLPPVGVQSGAGSWDLSAVDRSGDFVQTIDNPYWPLEPGTTYTYDGVRGTTPQTDVEVVTHQTKVILGIASTVVRDTVSEHGAPVERTFDWYARTRTATSGTWVRTPSS